MLNCLLSTDCNQNEFRQQDMHSDFKKEVLSFVYKINSVLYHKRVDTHVSIMDVYLICTREAMLISISC